jgi:beta-lactamase regulating signal transducer with metallopeptidase domain
MITLLACSVKMSALALLYMASASLLSKRYTERSRYYTWLIIVIGLIVPFCPQFSNAIVSINLPGETAASAIQVGNEARVTVAYRIAWWQIAATVWLAGVIISLACHAIKHCRFVKMTRRWSCNITDVQALTLFARPQIFLPTAELTRDELRFILKHELVHYKRKDLLYKYLVLVATAMHWFNPIVYLMAKAIDLLSELSCDAEVVRSTDTDTRQRYSETIIGVVKFRSKLRTALSTNFYGGKKDMKNRISSIMDTRKKKKGIVIASFLLFLTIGIGTAFAESSKPGANTAAYFDFEENLRQIYAEIERKWAEIEETSRASSVQTFSVYEQYGLTYKKETDRLYYNGELVRYFEDNQATDGTFRGTAKPGVDGNIDVHAVRNSAGKLIGVEPYNQADFNARTIKIRNENGNVSVSGGK